MQINYILHVIVFILLFYVKMVWKYWRQIWFFKYNVSLLLFLKKYSFGINVGTGIWEDIIIWYINKIILLQNQMMLLGNFTVACQNFLHIIEDLGFPFLAYV